jgi:hypothetical protein
MFFVSKKLNSAAVQPRSTLPGDNRRKGFISGDGTRSLASKVFKKLKSDPARIALPSWYALTQSPSRIIALSMLSPDVDAATQPLKAFEGIEAPMTFLTRTRPPSEDILMSETLVLEASSVI